jgi:hypothetical protein
VSTSRSDPVLSPQEGLSGLTQAKDSSESNGCQQDLALWADDEKYVSWRVFARAGLLSAAVEPIRSEKLLMVLLLYGRVRQRGYILSLSESYCIDRTLVC